MYHYKVLTSVTSNNNAFPFTPFSLKSNLTDKEGMNHDVQVQILYSINVCGLV